MTDMRRLLTELRRESLFPFVEAMFRELYPGTHFARNWHLRTVCWHLEEVAAGRCKRLIINVPPRSLKSFIGSVAFPAWVLGRDPSKKLVTCSYSKELASKLTGDFRRSIETPCYRTLFPRLSVQGKNTETEQRTSAGGHRYATSIGGTLTGYGGDIMIIDDPTKADSVVSEAERNAANEWFRNTLVTRLDNKTTGAIVIIMQRLHTDDLVGHLTVDEDHGWEIVSIPAIAVEDGRYRIGNQKGRMFHERKQGDVLDTRREPLETLNAIKRDIGSDRFSAQYQQMPVPPGGNLIRREWLIDCDELPSVADADAIVQSWDTALNAKEHNDFSVCTTWAVFDDRYYLIDVLRKRLEYPALKRAALDLVRAHRPNIVLIERAGAGFPLSQELTSEIQRRRLPSRLLSPTPRSDKETRVMGITALLEQGRLRLPRSAPWRDELLKECLGFPAGKHDDQVDSLEQFFRFMRSRRGPLRYDQASGEPERPRRDRR